MSNKKGSKYTLRVKRVRVPPIDRFFNMVRKTETCWEWLGSATTRGYAQLTIETGKIVAAYRWYYIQVKGEIPAGLVLDHLCRNKMCVNPDHLEAVTQAENIRRSPITVSTIHSLKTHCYRGHEFTPENTSHRRDRKGRRCLACARIVEKNRKRRIKEVTNE